MKRLAFLFLLLFSIFSFAQKATILTNLFFNDGTEKTVKIKYNVNLFQEDLIDVRAIINKKIVGTENDIKVKYLASDIKRLEFTDLQNKHRIFVHTLDFEKTLVELMYDGRIKWYNSFFVHLYDGHISKSTILVKDNSKHVLSLISNNKKILKLLMQDKPELEPLIEEVNYNRFNEEHFLNLLKKYDE